MRSLLTRFNIYYTLTKPGIIRGNIITALAGFFLAAGGHVDASRLLALVIGLSLIIASGCVCNNYMDRQLDKKMIRTRTRALVSGEVSGRRALLFAAILGLLGALVLVLGTSLLTTLLAVFGFVAYVFIYGLAKRRSVHGTVVGSFSGALPPVVGYCAASGRLDLGAVLIFLVLITWQMPHFYAIALYRLDDYAAAGIPVLPVSRGLLATKIQITIYIIGFTATALALTLFGYSGRLLLLVSLILGISWLVLSLRGLRRSADGAAGAVADSRWAHQMFGYSLLVISLFCVTIGVDSFRMR